VQHPLSIHLQYAYGSSPCGAVRVRTVPVSFTRIPTFADTWVRSADTHASARVRKVVQCRAVSCGRVHCGHLRYRTFV